MASLKRLKIDSETVAGQVDTLQAVDVLSSLNKFRLEEFICDFAIQVGDSTFPVHRAVLAAGSDYFKAMFSYDMKENQQGFVEMKDLESGAIKQCIEFMYTGKALINNGNIQCVLQAAHVMLLDNLVKYCYQQLTDNLNVQNSFFTKEIARVFLNAELDRTASKFVLDNFKDIISGEGFQTLKKEQVFGYVSSYDKDHEVTWKAIMSWIEYDIETRKKDLYDLMMYANVCKFPPGYLMETVWKNSIVKENSKIKDWIVACVFSRVDDLQSSIDFENCFLLKKLSKIHYHDNSKTVGEMVDFFIMWYLEKIIDMEEFLELDAADVQMYLEYAGTAPEIKKWEGALKWVKHDIGKRRMSFPKLFTAIDLDEMKADFIEKVVRAEILVKESDECKEIVMDTFSKKLRNLGPTQYVLALCKAPKKVMGLETVTNTWTTIIETPQISDGTKFARIVNVRNELYMLVDGSLYQMKKKVWIERDEMLEKPEETAQVVAFQNNIYVVEHNKLSKYDPKESMWKRDMQSCGIRWLETATTTADHIYAFGRSEGNHHTPEMKRFHPSQNIWENIANLGTARTSRRGGTIKYTHAAAVLDGMVYTCGGDNNYNGKSNEVWRYEPSSNTWSKINNMCHARSNFCAFSTGGSLYAFGGDDQSSPGTIEVYNKHTNQWRLLLGRLSYPISACDFIKYL